MERVVNGGALLPAPPLEVVAARLDALRRRIEAVGRDPAGVQIVAVTKGFDGSAVRAALELGLRAVGENYAAELLDKAADAPEGAVWHYLGAIQRRRVGALAPVVSCWQAVARVVEGETLARRAPGTTVFVEVALGDDPGRNGVAPGEVPALVAALRSLPLAVEGLMAVGPLGAPEAARHGFRTVRRLADELGLGQRSMGMSDDLEVALDEGATMVRVGRALFGPRAGAGAAASGARHDGTPR
ncbi:MAG: YggS family pyridoxal phosphate enzyme [Acidimicrobiales bacterium]